MSTELTAPRLKLVDPDTASKPIKEALALLPVINVFRAFANAETLYPYFANFMLHLFRPMELDKAIERMIVLHVAKRSDCLYAWRQNVVVAHSVGVTDEQLAALEKGTLRRVASVRPSRAPSPLRTKSWTLSRQRIGPTRA